VRFNRGDRDSQRCAAAHDWELTAFDKPVRVRKRYSPAPRQLGDRNKAACVDDFGAYASDRRIHASDVTQTTQKVLDVVTQNKWNHESEVESRLRINGSMSQKLSRRGRVKEPRIGKRLDGQIREALEYAKGLTGANYSEIDEALGKGERWSRNVLGRGEPLPVEAARLLMQWVEGVAAGHADKDFLNWIALVKEHFDERRPASLPTVPLLILNRDIDHVCNAFDAYLRQHNRTGAAGMLRSFLTRPATKPKMEGAPSYAEACAWHLAVLAGEACKNRRIKVGNAEFDGGSLKFLIHAFEDIMYPEKLPTTILKAPRPRRRES
jgi:hypothetical protein